MRTRILIVDDQEYLREIIATILAEAGYPAVAVDNPDHAMRVLDEMRPDLLVLDMSLPGIDGLQFLDWLRAKPVWETLPVVMVSGDPVKLSKVEGRPFVVPLSKPFDASVLVAEVTRFLTSAPLTQSA